MDLTDDSAVAEFVGLDVVMIEGTEENIKITHPGDLTARHPNKPGQEFRTGQGFDVHRFDNSKSIKKNFIILGGIKIENSKQLYFQLIAKYRS